jgi:hypothetical protein
MTSCPKTTLVSFDDLLNVMNYTATVWFQGLQNFTRMFNGMLSPVLYIIIGAMVERPDFELSSVRSQMLGIKLNTGYVSDYKKNSAALMTLGTQDFAPGDPTLYLPSFPPSRESAVASKLASKKQPVDFASEVKAQIELVKNKAQHILDIIKILPDIRPATIQTKDGEDEFKKQLIDFGLLAIKGDWLKRKFDDSYEALSSVFPDDKKDEIIDLGHGTTIRKMKLYCLCNDDTFLELPDLNCLDPTTEFLKTLPSKFNETRIDYDDPASREVNVIVDTLAQQYCMKFSYLKTPDLEVKKIYVMMQLSSTIVYTVATPNKILYAIDMQKTPIACLPEYKLNETLDPQAGGAKGAKGKKGKSGKPPPPPPAPAPSGAAAAPSGAAAGPSGVGKLAPPHTKPEVKKEEAEAERRERAATQAEHKRQTAFVDERQKKLLNLKAVMSTDRTIFSTAKRVASWGGFFAGKMMEYLFGQYFQLPTLFKQYAPSLQVCHAYCTTALMYNYNTSRPCVFFNTTPPLGKTYSFANLFATKLNNEGFIAPPAVPGAQPGGTPLEILAYVKERLNQHTAKIKQIGEIVTAPFLNYTSLDDSSTVTGNSSVSPESSTSVSSSASSVNSYFSLRNLMGRDISSQGDEYLWEPSGRRSEDDSMSPPQSRSRSLSPVGIGGSLITNKSIKKGITKRKNRKTTRKTTRKNGKVTRMFKKRKTYRRKANGRKLKGNNHKNNKTMRRYRRVRK